MEPLCQAWRAVPGWSHHQALPDFCSTPPSPELLCAPTSLCHKLPVYLSVSPPDYGPFRGRGYAQVASSSNSLAHSRSSENIRGSRKERQGKEGRERGGAGCSRAPEDHAARCLGSGPFCRLPHQLAGDTMAPRAWLPRARTLPLLLPMALVPAQPLEPFLQGEKALLSDSVFASGFDTIP